MDSRTTYAAKLTKLGIPATEEDVITSAFVLAHYLAHHAPELRYYVLGELNFVNELREPDYIRYRLEDRPGRAGLTRLLELPLAPAAASALFRKLAFLVIVSRKRTD